METHIRIASMFAGIGGICLGFKQSGCDIVWANDNDKDSCKTYRHNLGSGYLVEDDIRNVSASSLPDFDILTAGFPCQPFSILGRQKGFKDPRGNLFFEIAKVLDIKRPAVVFLENVANLIEHDEGKTFLVIYNTLVQFGYFVKYAVMDACEYGNVPQERTRIYIVAFLDFDKCNNFKYPEQEQLNVKPSDYINRTEKQADRYYYADGPLLSNLKKVVDEDGIYRITDYGVSKRKHIICPTLKANMGTFPDRVPIIKDNFGIRKLTPAECLALQGFPKNYIFPQDVLPESAYKEVGNTVCVPLVRKIAEGIMKVL